MENSTYYRLNEKENEMMKEISELTITDYEICGDFIPVDSLISALYEMLYLYHDKEEEIENLKKPNEPEEHDLWWDNQHGV